MRVCIISPVPDLERFVGDTRVHLLLAHLFDHPQIGERYREFYQRRRERNDYLILDNGAYEGAALPMPKLLEVARKVNATEVVLPDVPFHCRQTIANSSNALGWLMSNGGKRAYADAGKPRLMIVPHGRTLDQVMTCLTTLHHATRIAMNALGGPYPSVGVSKFHEIGLRGGVLRVLAALDFDAYQVHMLGWAGTWSTLRHVATRYPEIRSIDSARPLVYAHAGQKLDEASAKIRRTEDYFEKPVPTMYDGIARHNIDRFRRLVGSK